MSLRMDIATATITSRISLQSVRTRQPVVEDAVFGFRAAGAALLSNISYDKGTIVHWDPDAMKLV